MDETEPDLEKPEGLEELGLKNKSEPELVMDIMRSGESWTVNEKNMVLAAYELVKNLHSEDTHHRDKPYVYHLLRNTARLSGYLHINDPEIVVAELLHDSVEDHPGKLAVMYLGLKQEADSAITLPEDPFELERLALRYISIIFSERTAVIVAGLTNPPKLLGQHLDQEAAINSYIANMRQKVIMWEVWACKFVDWVDNGLGINYGKDFSNPERLARFGKKYGQALAVLESRFNQPDMQDMLDSAAKQYVIRCFELGRERLIVQ